MTIAENKPISDWHDYREAIHTTYRVGADAARDQLMIKEGLEGVKASV